MSVKTITKDTTKTRGKKAKGGISKNATLITDALKDPAQNVPNVPRENQNRFLSIKSSLCKLKNCTKKCFLCQTRMLMR